jgi:hypothetical protein
MAQPLTTHRWLRRSGVLTWICLLFGAVAAAVHWRSGLPGAYTWTKPIEVLWEVVGLRNFPALALGAYLFGIAARLGRREVARRARALLAGGAAPGRWVRPLLGGAALCAASLALFPLHDPLSRASAFLAGALLAGRAPRPRELLREAGQLAYVAAMFMVISYAFTVFKALLFVNGEPVDAAVVGFEASLWGFEPHRAVARWASSRPGWVLFLDRIYYRLFEHMALASVFLVGLRKLGERNALLGSLAFAYLLGALAYHFAPAVGPAFHDPGAFAYLTQDPRLISNIFRLRLLANTLAVTEGQARVLDTYEYLAAVPSLHMAHEFIMLYYARHSRLFFALSLAFTTLTGLSVLVLGWHYPVDIAAGGLLALAAIGLARLWQGVLLPQIFAGGSGEEASSPAAAAADAGSAASGDRSAAA